MRVGITLSVSSADLERLHALVSDRNAPQKHVWRARIVLLTGEGIGTSAIMRETSKSKTCVWRWQERFADEGFEGLLRDKTRPSCIPKLDPAVAERVVTLTMEPPVALKGGGIIQESLGAIIPLQTGGFIGIGRPNTGSRPYRRMPPSRRSWKRPNCAGGSSATIRNSSRNSGSITTKDEAGAAFTTTWRSASQPTDSWSPNGV
jgi:Winged helix-turn helix